MTNPRILLIITGSVAAYKSLLLIRQLRERGVTVTCILTKGGAEFVTPLSVAGLSEQPVYSDLFSLKDETEMGHIRLSRETDLILVAPASADTLAKMAGGFANDLASAVLLATDKPVAVAPAMNVQMWNHKATQRNVQQLHEDGAHFIGPQTGDMACGETGEGRMAEPEDIVKHVLTLLPVSSLSRRERAGGEGTTTSVPPDRLNTASPHPLPKGEGTSLAGRTALVTAGPTFEALDPVRFLGNRSSGKQGYAIAIALAAAGAEVTLISGPTALPTPPNVTRIDVESADAMLQACEEHLPTDMFIASAAVSDWKPRHAASGKLKKRDSKEPPTLSLTETSDILHTLATHKQRPKLVIGFAAETTNNAADLAELAETKRRRKGCDWLLANNVSGGAIFGDDNTAIRFFSDNGPEDWSDASSKHAVAQRLVENITTFFNAAQDDRDPKSSLLSTLISPKHARKKVRS